jgi:hypothetical protein
MRPRLVILNNEILPYRIPLFRALADDPQSDLQVLYCARRGWDRSWTVPRDSPAFDHTVKPEYHIVEGQWTTGLLPQVSSLTSLQGGLLTTHEEEAKRLQSTAPSSCCPTSRPSAWSCTQSTRS